MSLIHTLMPAFNRLPTRRSARSGPVDIGPSIKPAYEIREADDAFGDRGRHLIRYSGTEHKVRILVEHRDADVVDAWSTRLRGVIEQELA